VYVHVCVCTFLGMSMCVTTGPASQYLKGMQAARAAFLDRTQAVVTVQTLAGDSAAKRGKLGAAQRGGAPARGHLAREEGH